MINFLKETLDVLDQHGKTIDDVLWIGVKDQRLESPLKIYEEFNFEYDNGYGSAYIPLDLKIVGNGWWLERDEYDGSEWWAYYEPPCKKPEKIFTNLISHCGKYGGF